MLATLSAYPRLIPESLLYGPQNQGEAYLLPTYDLALPRDLDKGISINNQINVAICVFVLFELATKNGSLFPM